MEPSHLDLHCLQMCVRIYLMSEFTRLYPTVNSEIFERFLIFAKLGGLEASRKLNIRGREAS